MKFGWQIELLEQIKQTEQIEQGQKREKIESISRSTKMKCKWPNCFDIPISLNMYTQKSILFSVLLSYGKFLLGSFLYPAVGYNSVHSLRKKSSCAGWINGFIFACTYVFKLTSMPHPNLR